MNQHILSYFYIIQYPGEFIISLGGGYHQCFNCGTNIAEAINFGSDRWVESFGKYESSGCKYKYK